VKRDRRPGYLIAAEETLKEASKFLVRYPGAELPTEYWANLAVAQIYATLATVPSEVVEPVVEAEIRREALQKRQHMFVLAELNRSHN
jgi:hypothetical protein